jgi:hypothetical protein
LHDLKLIARYEKLRSNLTTKLKETKLNALRTEIRNRIGPLGQPDKMPGYAWGISAVSCKTGSKLAQIEGTPCHVCYALRNRYRMSNVVNAQQERLNGFNDPDWAELMAIRLLTYAERHPHFRWFDSGDVQSELMMYQIHKVAAYTNPWVTHWLPTQERGIVKATHYLTPSNLTIRVSSTKLGEQQTNPYYPTSFVGHHDQKIDGVVQCPSRLQNNQCQKCRACWDPDVKYVEYHQH